MMQHKKTSKDHTVGHKINKRVIALHQGSEGIRYQQPRLLYRMPQKSHSHQYSLLSAWHNQEKAI